MSNTGAKVRRVLKGALKFLQNIRTIIQTADVHRIVSSNDSMLKFQKSV